MEFEPKGTWLSLMDYAVNEGVSLSTARRHIKHNKVLYKVQNGRYLLWVDARSALTPDKALIQKLTRDLRDANREIVELKTLIAFYEEKNSN